jgi:hypothetical protein
MVIEEYLQLISGDVEELTKAEIWEEPERPKQWILFRSKANLRDSR